MEDSHARRTSASYDQGAPATHTHDDLVMGSPKLPKADQNANNLHLPTLSKGKKRLVSALQHATISKGAKFSLATKVRSRGKSTGGRGAGFSEAEVEYLLDLVDAYLPLCGDEWDMVQREFKKKYPETARTTDSLKRKFSTLHRHRILTGDPHIPPAVRQAKEIHGKITERTDIGTGEDTEGLGIVDTDEEEDEDSLQVHDRQEPGATLLELTGTDGCPSFSLPDRNGKENNENEKPLPRQLVMKRRPAKKDEADDFATMMKMSILQDEKRRAAEHEQRIKDREEERERQEMERERYEAERKLALERYEAERREARERQQEESRKHERTMQLSLMLLTKGDAA